VTTCGSDTRGSAYRQWMNAVPMPAAATLARHLRERQVPAVIVGGTARWLVDPTSRRPRDLDVLLPATDDALAALERGLAELDPFSRTRRPRRGAELPEWEPWQLRTRLGNLDVFVLRSPAERTTEVLLHGVPVPVAVRPTG